MKKWNLIIDIAKCHDCNNCFLACKDEFCENEYPHYSASQSWHGQRWMNIMRKERGQYPAVDVAYLPLPCMHCDEPACMDVAQNNAVNQREDGIVIIDPVKAKGQKELIESCPYGAIWWNDEEQLPQKCNLCAHLLDSGWKEPRCVQSCPTGALSVILGDKEEMDAKIESDQLEVYQTQFNTKPGVHYKNLYRFTQCFIAGSVALEDIDECAEGALVNLYDGRNSPVSECKSNNYGDFKFDRLLPNSGTYHIDLEYPGYKKQSIKVNLTKSITLDATMLSKK